MGRKRPGRAGSWSDLGPEEPGWYWHRAGPGGEPVVLRVVRDIFGGLKCMPSVLAPALDVLPAGQWCGPIRPPE